MQIDQKWDHLRSLLSEMRTVLLAYSGGVDSSLLLRAAAETLGQNVIAVTAISETYPAEELHLAKRFTASLGVQHRVLQTEELSREAFSRNDKDRCYHCKQELFGKLRQIAVTEGIPWILDGSNIDDQRDYRPGRRAAGEFSIRSPLAETGLSKQEIRDLARCMDLPMWDKPSLACLSSRIPYGTRITPTLVKNIQAAEDVVRGLGIRQVRVRHHGDTARIEVDREDLLRLMSEDAKRLIVDSFKALGYAYICVDLEGYRTGSMNEVMKERRTG